MLGKEQGIEMVKFCFVLLGGVMELRIFSLTKGCLFYKRSSTTTRPMLVLMPLVKNV